MLAATPLAALPSMVAQHFDNAVHLREYRARLLMDLCWKMEDLAQYDERLEANLDGLRIIGKAGIEIGQAAAADDPQAAGVVAMLLAGNDCDQAATQAASLLRHVNAETRQSAWWGLRLVGCRHVEPHLRALLRVSRWNFASAAALDILAFHRLPSQTDLETPLDGESDEVVWLLAEAGGRIPRAWNANYLKRFLAHESPRVREAALRASARCGLPELPALCREAASQMNPRDVETIEFLGIVGSSEDLSLLRRTASDPLTANAALAALGRLGPPASVPTLLEFLSAPETADYAAAAIERITGQQLPRDASPDPPPCLTEDELDLWEPKPPVDVVGANDWWSSNAARFDPSKRWQAGLCVSDDPLGSVFDQLPLGIRYDVYLRQRALVPGTPDWELETWTWKQKNPGG